MLVALHSAFSDFDSSRILDAPSSGVMNPPTRSFAPANLSGAAGMRRNRVANPRASSPHALIEHSGAARAVVEKFIRRCFAERFGAHVDAFMPRLFTVQRNDGIVCGAFGLRSAHRRLFIEHYLDKPIEQAIAASAKTLVERRGIVEIGHFSGTSAGAMRAMIALLIERLHHEGFEWVAFTGTHQLRNAFHRMGLFPLDLGAARIEAIPAEARAAWGNYYEQSPRVLAGRILDGFAALECGGIDAGRT
jgi:hypothetical protein